MRWFWTFIKFLLGIMFLSVYSVAQHTYYVDPAYNCGTCTTNSGTALHPWTDLSQGWSTINGLSSGPVTVYFSAGSTQLDGIDISSCTTSFCTNSSTATSNFTLDGVSEKGTVNTGAGTESWAATGVSLAQCTDFRPTVSATCPADSATKYIVQAGVPITGPASSTDFSNCIYGFTIQGFSFQATNGQAALMTYVGNLTFQHNELLHTVKGSNGPGLYIGPGQHGPCHTGAARSGGTDSGPDNVSVISNYIHDNFGEMIYDGASTSDPFVPFTSPATVCGTGGSTNECEQYEGGSANSGPGGNLACSNGCASNSYCGTAATANAATCNTGANHQIIGNMLETGAVWGGKGDCVDIKDGHFNVLLSQNVCRPGLYDSNCTATGAACACYNGTNAGNSCTTDSGCTGGGVCRAGGAQSRGFVFEGDDGVIDSNYCEGPFRDCIYLASAWNDKGGGSVRVSNNIIVDVNSGIGHNYAVEAATPSANSTSGNFAVTIANCSIYNNTVYDVGNNAGDTGGGLTVAPGSYSNTCISKNNIVSTSYFGGSYTGGVTAAYNNYFNNTTGSCPNGETGTICTDPKFTSTTLPPSSALNFSLQGTSGAIATGTSLSSIFTNDYSQNTRSGSWWMGAIGASGSGIPSTLFGIHWDPKLGFNPQVNYGTIRMWGSSVYVGDWQTTQTGASTYSYTLLDNFTSKIHGTGTTDVMMELWGTPNFISSDPTNAQCQNPADGNGACGVPTDIAASCTNSNNLFNCDGKTDGTNQTWRNFIYNVAVHISNYNPAVNVVPTSFEIWNEFPDKNPNAQLTSWEGTDAQMVRMAQDANCILTGRGTITSQGNAACNASNMGVAAVNILPGSTILTPSALIGQNYDRLALGSYLATAGALNSVDVITMHEYTDSGNPTNAELLISNLNSMAPLLTTAGTSCTALPCWSTEGSWGQSANLLSDQDMQAAYVARYYLLGWANNFQRMYWFAYDAQNIGTLWNPDGTNGCAVKPGCLTKAGTAFNIVYGWMVGNKMTGLCAIVSGTVYTCTLTQPSGLTGLAVWDTSQSCSGGSCGTSTYSYPAGYTSYSTISSNTLVPLSGGTVQIGAKPILLYGLPALTPPHLLLLGVGE